MAEIDPPLPADDRGKDQAQPGFSDMLGTVRSLVEQARRTEAAPSGVDWSAISVAVDALERHGPGAVPTTTVSASPIEPPNRRPDGGRRLFVAIVGIDRFSGLSELVAEPVLSELRRRIEAEVGDAHLGRVNRSSLEFTFASPSAAEAERELTDLHRKLEEQIALPGRLIALDVVIGFAAHDGGDHIEAVTDRAEHALAKARAGHLKVVAFTEKDSAERAERLSLMRDLRQARGQGELFVVYQPKMSLRTSSIDGVEALVRWRHPTRGLIAPEEFIGLAEESGEIRALTEFVVEQSMADHDALARSGHDLLVHVNISGRLLADEDFAAWVLATTRGRSEGLGFEITETAVIADPQRALRNIRAFTEAGIEIALDDYGAGLSSLSYLKQIPAHELKIDREFVTALTSSHRDPLLVRSTIDLAHALGMKVTAEGVDNVRSLSLLKVMGCDMVQGYYLSKPLSFEDLVAFVQAFDGESLVGRLTLGAIGRRV